MSHQESSKQSWKDQAKYAGFYIRFLASIIDTVVLIVPMSAVLGVVFVVALGEQPKPDMSAYGSGISPEQAKELMLAHFTNPEYISRWLTENIVSTLVAAALTIFFWWRFAATPGKMVLGLKIVDAESGLPTTPRQDMVRYFGYFVSIIPGLLGFLWVVWDKRAQGWHDKMAHTVVVHKDSLPMSLRDLTYHASHDT